ncbi:unannotated protein [freshwater metagenome]|uniref:Unannotated protein n=1 Tax=freshwater metagenome TaxID=449393 RepID=A0A6J7P7W9_9ZZZZ
MHTREVDPLVASVGSSATRADPIEGRYTRRRAKVAVRGATNSGRIDVTHAHIKGNFTSKPHQVSGQPFL